MTTTTPVSDKKLDAQRSKRAEMARKAVFKMTELKTIPEDLRPIPCVPSGSICIDDLIGGTPAADNSGPKCPGYPRRKITEIYGAESSGKTTAALQSIAEVQKQGGLAAFLDFEHALDIQYAKRIGVSFEEDKLVRLEPTTMEEGWKAIYALIIAGVDLIVVDSVAAMVPETELNKKKPGEAPKIGAVAASMAQTLPKVCIWLKDPKYSPNNPEGTALVFLNQIRAAIGGNGTSENTSGGYALKFFSSLRIKFTKIRSEGKKRKDPMTGAEKFFSFGNHTQVKLIKSKIDGKQGHASDIFIRFNYGIDNYYSLIEAAAANKLVRKSGAFFEYEGQKFQGRDKFKELLVAKPAMFNDLRSKLLKAVRDPSMETPELEDEDELLANYDATLDAPDPEVVEEELADEPAAE